jgi:hemoglobin
VDQLCNVTGGSCIYIGLTLKDSPKGMKISENNWTIKARLLIESLNKFKMPLKEQNEFLAIVGSVKKDIVEIQ